MSSLSHEDRALVIRILRLFTLRPNVNRPEVAAADKLAVRLAEEQRVDLSMDQTSSWR